MIPHPAPGSPSVPRVSCLSEKLDLRISTLMDKCADSPALRRLACLATQMLRPNCRPYDHASHATGSETLLNLQMFRTTYLQKDHAFSTHHLCEATPPQSTENTLRNSDRSHLFSKAVRKTTQRGPQLWSPPAKSFQAGASCFYLQPQLAASFSALPGFLVDRNF